MEYVIGILIGVFITSIVWFIILKRLKSKVNIIGDLFTKQDPEDGEIYIFMQLENCSPNDVLTMDKVVLTVRHETVEKATDAKNTSP